MLFCNASGNPSPAINWTKQGSDQLLHEGETYSIAKITRQEAGSYLCSAGNGVGLKQQRIAVVTVHCEFLVYCSSILVVNILCLAPWIKQPVTNCNPIFIDFYFVSVATVFQSRSMTLHKFSFRSST